MTSRRALANRQTWFLACALAILALDQSIKNLFIETLTTGQSVNFLGSLVKFNLTFNDSAAFSIGFGATWIFTVTSSLAAIALLWYSFKIQARSWSVMAGILLGGILGNLIDRLFRAPGFGIGHVVDYIQIPFNFPIFNIADMAIFSICTLSVIRIMRGDSIGRTTPQNV